MLTPLGLRVEDVVDRRGTIISNWRMDGDRMRLELEIPPNTTPEVRLPAAEAIA